MYVNHPYLQVEDTLIANNAASQRGGGVYLANSVCPLAGAGTDFYFANTQIVGNSAGLAGGAFFDSLDAPCNGSPREALSFLVLPREVTLTLQPCFRFVLCPDQLHHRLFDNSIVQHRPQHRRLWLRFRRFRLLARLRRWQGRTIRRLRERQIRFGGRTH